MIFKIIDTSIWHKHATDLNFCFQILSTSGESGFFEGSSGGESTFTDLHAFLESDPNNVPIDSRDQQASDT